MGSSFLGAGDSVLYYVTRARRDGGVGAGDVGHDPEVGTKPGGGQAAADVAALGVEELDVGVVAEGVLALGPGVDAVSAGADGGAGEFGSDGGGIGALEVELEVVDLVGVEVAGQDDGVRGAALVEEGHEAVAVGGVAVPLVHGEGEFLFALEEPSHEDLVGEDVVAGG